MTAPEVPRDLRQPHPLRLPADAPYRDEILARHEAALAAGATSYLDPATGYNVLTAAFLWERDECCHSGCRHCPYLAR